MLSKTSNILTLVALAIALNFSAAKAADTLRVDVFSNGGAVLEVSSVATLRCSFGPTPIRGNCVNFKGSIENGFWPAAMERVTESSCGFVEFAPLIDAGGKIDISRFEEKELTALMNYLFNEEDKPSSFEVYDVNNDGNTNILDLVLIMQHLNQEVAKEKVE